MKDPLFSTFFSKWKELIAPSDVCLVALSGGIDSMALYHLATEAGKLTGNMVHAVHVDHRMREESSEQALLLSKWTGCEVLALSGAAPEKDIENQLRIQRYDAIRKVYENLGATVLLTGHHADDQVETVLKRIFEGASLVRLGGIDQELSLFEMNVKRPLLSLYKKDLEAYLSKKRLPHIEDSSNCDPLFTRNRIRNDILPYLEQSFGKNIKNNLLALSEEARLMRGKSVGKKEVKLEELQQLNEAELHHHIVTWYPKLTRSEKEVLRSLIRQKKYGKQVQGIVVSKNGLIES